MRDTEKLLEFRALHCQLRNRCREREWMVSEEVERYALLRYRMECLRSRNQGLDYDRDQWSCRCTSRTGLRVVQQQCWRCFGCHLSYSHRHLPTELGCMFASQDPRYFPCLRQVCPKRLDHMSPILDHFNRVSMWNVVEEDLGQEDSNLTFQIRAQQT